MKTDLVTSILAAIVGLVGGYLLCNYLIPPITEVSFPTIDPGESSYSLEQPDAEIFNYRAINPTVEVYVGQCAAYDSQGECVESENAQPSEQVSGAE